MKILATWPDDADGDVMRRLETGGFDFSRKYDIDFNIEFKQWPPHPNAMAWLKARYDHVVAHEPDEASGGYVQLIVHSKLTYPFILETQSEATSGVQKYGGVCEFWGVLH